MSKIGSASPHFALEETLFVFAPFAYQVNSRFWWIYCPIKKLSFLLHSSGGVRTSMYGKLPAEIVSTKGYQGCLASLDLGGEAADPLNNAVVPSSLVEEGCDGKWSMCCCGTVKQYYRMTNSLEIMEGCNHAFANTTCAVFILPSTTCQYCNLLRLIKLFPFPPASALTEPLALYLFLLHHLTK